MEVGFGRKPRLDKKAVVAWWLDVDGGYRNAAERRWQFVDLGTISSPRLRQWQRQSLELASVAGDHANVPPVRVEPCGTGRFMIDAPMRLVVQPYDEHLPRAVEAPVELPYGSVVRAGPLLFSVLYAEQVASLEEGKFTLPFVGGALDLHSDVEDLAAFSRPLEERGRILQIWKGFFGSSFLVAAALAILVVLSRGLYFRYGNSPLDTVAACVGCVFLAWSALLVVGLPIQRAIVSWVYSAESGTGEEGSPGELANTL